MNPKDPDAAFNLTFVTHNLGLLTQFRVMARQAKAAADEATRSREYHRAFEIMTSLLQHNPLGKQFEDYTKKLSAIDAILNPQPAQAQMPGKP